MADEAADPPGYGYYTSKGAMLLMKAADTYNTLHKRSFEEIPSSETQTYEPPPSSGTVSYTPTPIHNYYGSGGSASESLLAGSSQDEYTPTSSYPPYQGSTSASFGQKDVSLLDQPIMNLLSNIVSPNKQQYSSYRSTTESHDKSEPELKKSFDPTKLKSLVQTLDNLAKQRSVSRAPFTESEVSTNTAAALNHPSRGVDSDAHTIMNKDSRGPQDSKVQQNLTVPQDPRILQNLRVPQDLGVKMENNSEENGQLEGYSMNSEMLGKDKKVIRDFFPNEYRTLQLLTSQLEALKQAKETVLKQLPASVVRQLDDAHGIKPASGSVVTVAPETSSVYPSHGESRIQSLAQDPQTLADSSVGYSSSGYEVPQAGYETTSSGYHAPPAVYLATPSDYHSTSSDYHATPSDYHAAPSGYETSASNYQTAPSRYEAAPSNYGATPSDYGAAPSNYGAAQSDYGAAPSDYGAAPSGYGAAPSGYGAAPSGYGAAPSGYETPLLSYETTSSGYNAAPSGYATPQLGYEATQAREDAPYDYELSRYETPQRDYPTHPTHPQQHPHHPTQPPQQWPRSQQDYEPSISNTDLHNISPTFGQPPRPSYRDSPRYSEYPLQSEYGPSYPIEHDRPPTNCHRPPGGPHRTDRSFEQGSYQPFPAPVPNWQPQTGLHQTGPHQAGPPHIGPPHGGPLEVRPREARPSPPYSRDYAHGGYYPNHPDDASERNEALRSNRRDDGDERRGAGGPKWGGRDGDNDDRRSVWRGRDGDNYDRRSNWGGRDGNGGYSQDRRGCENGDEGSSWVGNSGDRGANLDGKGGGCREQRGSREGRAGDGGGMRHYSLSAGDRLTNIEQPRSRPCHNTTPRERSPPRRCKQDGTTRYGDRSERKQTATKDDRTNKGSYGKQVEGKQDGTIGKPPQSSSKRDRKPSGEGLARDQSSKRACLSADSVLLKDKAADGGTGANRDMNKAADGGTGANRDKDKAADGGTGANRDMNKNDGRTGNAQQVSLDAPNRSEKDLSKTEGTNNRKETSETVPSFGTVTDKKECVRIARSLWTKEMCRLCDEKDALFDRLVHLRRGKPLPLRASAAKLKQIEAVASEFKEKRAKFVEMYENHRIKMLQEHTADQLNELASKESSDSRKLQGEIKTEKENQSAENKMAGPINGKSVAVNRMSGEVEGAVRKSNPDKPLFAVSAPLSHLPKPSGTPGLMGDRLAKLSAPGGPSRPPMVDALFGSPGPTAEASSGSFENKDSVVEKPARKEIVFEKPTNKDSVVKQSTKKEIIFEKPVIKDSVVKPPTKKAIVFEKPTNKDSVVNKPTKKEIVFEKPTNNDSVVNKPIKNEIVFKIPTNKDRAVEKFQSKDIVVKKPEENSYLAPNDCPEELTDAPYLLGAFLRRLQRNHLINNSSKGADTVSSSAPHRPDGPASQRDPETMEYTFDSNDESFEEHFLTLKEEPADPASLSTNQLEVVSKILYGIDGVRILGNPDQTEQEGEMDESNGEVGLSSKPVEKCLFSGPSDSPSDSRGGPYREDTSIVPLSNTFDMIRDFRSNLKKQSRNDPSGKDKETLRALYRSQTYTFPWEATIALRDAQNEQGRTLFSETSLTTETAELVEVLTGIKQEASEEGVGDCPKGRDVSETSDVVDGDHGWKTIITAPNYKTPPTFDPFS